MEACHVGGFDDVGKFDKFGKLSSNCQIHANKLNTWRPAMLADLTILASVKKLAKFCQFHKCMQVSQTYKSKPWKSTNITVLENMKNCRHWGNNRHIHQTPEFQSLGEISSHSSYFPNSWNSSNSPLRWYPSLEFIQLNFSLWRSIVIFAIFTKFIQFVEFTALLLQFSWAYSTEFQSLANYHQIWYLRQIRRIRRPVDTLLLSLFNWILVFSEISSHSPSLPSSSNSLKSLLCWYPSLELIQLNFSLAKCRQICHICQVRRIRWNHRSVGTLLLSLFNRISVFGEISSHSPSLQNSSNSLNSPLCWYPSLQLIQLNFSLWWNSITFAIFANILEFVEFAALLVPFSWAYSTEFQSLAKYRQICHICQVRRIRWIRRSVDTLLLSLFNWISVFGQISSDLPYLQNLSNSPPGWYPSPELIQLNFSLWRNIVKFAIFAKFVEFVEFADLLIPFSWAYSTEFQSLAKYHQTCHICKTCRIRRPVGTLLLSLFNWISVFGKISSNLPYLPSSSNSLNSPLCWYPSLELIQLNFSLWRTIIKFAIFAKFLEFAALLIPFSWAYSTEF